MVLATQRYAKRQLTWGRTQFNFPMLNLSGAGTPRDALSAALDALDSPPP